MNAPLDWEECVAFAAVICGSAIVTGISRWPSQATHTLLGIWKWLLRCRWGAWPSWTSPEEFFLCLSVFVAWTRTVIPQKREPGFDILNPKRDLLRSLCISWSPPGVVEAIHWNSISYLCPLKSQYGVREPLPALSWHTLLLSPSPPSYATDPTGYSQIRHMSGVYLLINCRCKLLCSKNGMSELSGLGKNNRSWWHNMLSYREANNSSSRFFWGELVSYQACWVCSAAFVSQSKMAP